MTEPLVLTALRPPALAEACGIELGDARRIVSLVHRTGDLPARAPATVRRSALDAVKNRCVVRGLTAVERRESAVDPFVKFAFRLHDHAIIETVRVPLKHPGRFVACVSSQVGCGLGCAFCATGRMGLDRNLEVWEIVEQVRHVATELRAAASPAGVRGRVHGVLFQGMGEPLANVDRVIRAIGVLCDPSAQAIDMRNVTVCTAGLPSGIARLARDAPSARLGISIGSLRSGRRRTLMPIDAVHPLAEVLAAAAAHARITRISPMWAYTLMEGENDADSDAELLADAATRFADHAGVRPRLSLVPYNAIGNDAFRRTSPDRLDGFRAVLSARGVGAAVRYSGGADVGAACGQLARAPRDAAARSAESAGRPELLAAATRAVDPRLSAR